MNQGKYGPVNPQDYPTPPGPNYYTYGERPGWVYNPYDDKYYPNRQEQGDYLRDQGALDKKKKEPGLAATAGTVVGGAAAVKLGTDIGSGQYGISDLTGIFGDGGTQAAGQVGTQAAADVAFDQAAQYGVDTGLQYGAQTASEAALAEGGGASTTSTLSAVQPWLTAAAIAYASYKNYQGLSKAKKAVGGGPLTDKEIRKTDMLGSWEDLKDKVIPSELRPFGSLRELGFKHILGFGSTKNDDQIMRDRVRKNIKEFGLVDDDWNVDLAGGAKFDIGKDGQEAAYNVDFDNPLAHGAAAWSGAFARVFTGGNEKLKDDFTGYFANAAMSNAKDLGDVRKNLIHMMESKGLTGDKVIATLNEQLQEGQIDQQTFDIHMNSLSELYEGRDPTAPPGPAQQVALPPQIPGGSETAQKAQAGYEARNPADVAFDQAAGVTPVKRPLTPEEEEAFNRIA